MWRMKIMDVNDWGDLKDHFEYLFEQHGAPLDCAMIRMPFPDDGFDAIFYTGVDQQLIETLSIGDWNDIAVLPEHPVDLLVGHAKAWEHFQLPQH